MNKKNYRSIDGLRTIACVGIVMMHMMTNNSYALPGTFAVRMIKAFTDFVYLFMMVSAFGMCCGYLERMQNGRISMEDFYKKRYAKILPFFTCLVLLDILLSRSKEAVIEGFADVTLLFGLFPNDISVIGVGWFLGLVFAFYLIFPFYSVLLKTKKRAWFFFAVSLLLNGVCKDYFRLNRTNIVYSLCYFMAGGLIYLYREELERFSEKYGWAVLTILAVCIGGYFLIGARTVILLAICASMLILAMGHRAVLDNRFTHFISSVSMEIYLSHMVVFRILEKLKLNRIMGNGWGQYLLTVVLTVAGSAVGAVVFQKLWSALHKRLVRV